LADKFTLEISDGERQLLAIARVLIQETPYILLDEPTAFLDYSNKKSLLNLLMKIARDENKCILFSSHDLELTLGFSPDSICIPSNSIDIQHLTGKSYSIEDVIELCFT
jgi:iron complex transport system ATP-binding protein